MFARKEGEAPKGAALTSRFMNGIVHGRFIILSCTLISVVALLVYLEFARMNYEVRGTLSFVSDGGANTNVVSDVMAADYLDRVATAAGADGVLSDAARKLDPSQLGMLGIGTYIDHSNRCSSRSGGNQA